MPIPRVLLHLTGHRRRAIDPADVYYLEAQGDETFMRLRGKTRLKDVRSLGEVLPTFKRHGEDAIDLLQLRHNSVERNFTQFIDFHIRA